MSKELKYEYLMEYEARVEGPYKASEDRSIFPVADGWFKGPKLQGKIIHGADWMITRESGIHCPDVILTFMTNDGSPIFVKYNGVLIWPEKEGELAFLRTYPMFSASGKYAWLNKVAAVGVGTNLDLKTGKVKYDVFQIV